MRARLIAVLAVVALVAMACSNADDKKGDNTTTTTKGGGGGGTAVDQPGVTADTIRVGGVVSKTNILNGPYGSAFDGVKAYFNMVNDAGGIYDRKLELVSERDDQMGQNQQQVEALLSQDNVFAALPMATIVSFTGAQKLVDENVPTFGWNINEEFTGQKNLFGSNYGALDLGGVGSVQPFVAKQLGKKKIGVLAYNQASSADCATGIEKSFEKYPSAKVVFVTKSITFGATDYSVEVKQMKDKGVDFVLTCIDDSAALALGKEIRKQDLNAIQYLPNGYNSELAAANAEFLEGDIVGVPFAPFETRPKPPGLVEFDKWMDKGKFQKNELAMAGWLSAAMFYEGLKGAGPNFTRQKVIDWLNQQTDMTLGGLIPARDWTKDHEIRKGISCVAYVKIENGKFVPTFNEPGKPFQCVPDEPATLPAKATFQ
jgi:ABC-type branched-subunit amino acid transport system substrate-binding protein